ncbi:MAG: type II secretion system major pseudopilin GspG [Sedimentisphaerales bacterium]|nr:type II secretion system major pseudopilin GspG [Sedimentisphaerales bacterium]
MSTQKFTTKYYWARGFTIVEVLVVILLIGLLSVLIVPPILNKVDKSKKEIARSQIDQLSQEVEQFALDCGRYPDASEGLKALLEAPSGLKDKWAGPYGKEKQLIDPWGKPLVYLRPGTKNTKTYDIISYGKDGQPGGEGYNADIVNE